MEDFIRVYENAFDKEFCEELIKNFEWAEERGMTLSRQQAENGVPKSRKKDTSIHATEFDLHHTTRNLGNGFTDVFLNNAYAQYCEEFSETLIDNTFDTAVYSMKAQKTNPSGGYHTWHYEASNRDTCNRVMAWTVYLNDVPEGGETEFLYQQKRVKPKQGSCMIFPAAFTHLHRGNPPIGGSKYIITGWVEF